MYVTDANGRHAHRMFARANGGAPPPNQVRSWDIDGLAWAPGNHRLYFSMKHIDRFTDDRIGVRLWSVHVTSSGHKSGPASRVPGGSGLSSPTTDPTSGRVAAVRIDSGSGWCAEPPEETVTETSTIVLLDPATGDTHDLLTIASPPAFCASAIDHLAWSPDGTQIAFDQISLPHGYYTSQVDLVAVDGSDGAAPRVVAANDPGDDPPFVLALPTWQTAHSLWYARWREDDGASDTCSTCTMPDLFSVSVSDAGIGTPAPRTQTPTFSEKLATFG